MRIDFLVNNVSGGWEPYDVRLGGTERGVIEWGEELASRGHEVTIYRNGRGNGVSEKTYPNGGSIGYYPRESYVRSKGEVCINVKSPEIPPKVPTIFYTNDVDADKQDLSEYSAVIHISNWAKENIPVNNPNVFVVPHGYDDSKIMPQFKHRKQCIYTSSPDRGLDTLIRAWLTVGEQHPDATLLVTYGADGPDIPGVEYLGDLPEEEMDELYRSSEIWCHPASGGELQCIAGLKAQAANCIPVVIPTMALSETVRAGFFAQDDKDYASKLNEALEGSQNDRIRHQLSKERFTTIKQSTDKLLEVIHFTLDGHNS